MQVHKRKISYTITIISVIIGFMLSIQFNSTQNTFKMEARDITELRSNLSKELERKNNLLNDLSKKRQLLNQYKNNNQNQQISQIISDELGHAKLLAGTIPVEGKGLIVRITAMDSSFSEIGEEDENEIVDDDLRTLVNEMFGNGAQAISINDQRLVSVSAIRNVGNRIQVNNRFITFPYEIKAIGDAKMIQAGIQIAGLQDYFKILNKELIIAEQEKIQIPAYNGDINPRYMKPVKVGEK
ncbi:DUF881 domain-containing protein [Tepidibacillus decaturensis]|uniref:DUF881 domain-containing protein n=1 Tax=Tepidibacillus decaturensis TaxID=1413211 RepID=A0A135L455_9BACI|nr:DUF881 domain-containing protein [Tepidibacillus decaturensis]KXG43766.1 hypothetical protein U473_06880 [Tepidibacillus decaturensis]